jgi:hypothetical protein
MASYQETLDESESICDKVWEIDPLIRFVGIISDKGRLLAGRKKEGIKLHVNEKDHEMLFMGIALKQRMRREYDEQLGPVDFTVSYRAKCVVMGFPIGENTLYVSGGKDLDLTKIPSKILEIINHSFNESDTICPF